MGQMEEGTKLIWARTNAGTVGWEDDRIGRGEARVVRELPYCPLGPAVMLRSLEIPRAGVSGCLASSRLGCGRVVC